MTYNTTMQNNIIKTWTIHNFQSHADTVFDLHPGINAIIGDSDKGKSAALRSLFWAITNKPAGDAYISDWCRNEKGQLKKGQGSRVTVETVGGKTCSRIRSADMNGYEVNGILCEAIRTEIPQEALDFFNFSEVNIQQQADAPFLLAAPAGEVARFFNRIIKLEEIDLVLANIESRRRKTKQQIEEAQNTIEATSKRIEELGWVDALNLVIDKAGKLEAEIAQRDFKIAAIGTDLEQYKQLAQKLESVDKIQEAKNLLAVASGLADKVQFAAIRVNIISTSLKDAIPLQACLMSTRGVVTHGPDLVCKAKAAMIQITALEPKCAAMGADLQLYRQGAEQLERRSAVTLASEFLAKLRKLESRIVNKTQSIVTLAAEVAGYDFQAKLYKEAKKSIEELAAQRPDICPVCGKAWNHAET